MNVIFNAFAFQKGYNTSPNFVGNKRENEIIDTYMQNIFVSLRSAKLKNPQDDVILVTNEKSPLKYVQLFEYSGIKEIVIPFNRFTLPPYFVWSLAFFKLCALAYMVENTDYERYLLLDADTYTVKSYDELWQESKYGIMLFNIGHSFLHRDRLQIVHDYHNLYTSDKNVVHYGGEFIAGTRDLLIRFIKQCQKVYDDIKSNGFNIAKNAGDETIISIAAMDMPIIEAGAYVFRYWTTKHFYLVSSNYFANQVAVLHVPNEKNNAFIDLYRYYHHHNAFPPIFKVAQMMGFSSWKRPFIIDYFFKKLRTKWKAVYNKLVRI